MLLNELVINLNSAGNKVSFEEITFPADKLLGSGAWKKFSLLTTEKLGTVRLTNLAIEDEYATRVALIASNNYRAYTENQAQSFPTHVQPPTNKRDMLTFALKAYSAGDKRLAAQYVSLLSVTTSVLIYYVGCTDWR